MCSPSNNISWFQFSQYYIQIRELDGDVYSIQRVKIVYAKWSIIASDSTKSWGGTSVLIFTQEFTRSTDTCILKKCKLYHEKERLVLGEEMYLNLYTE